MSEEKKERRTIIFFLLGILFWVLIFIGGVFPIIHDGLFLFVGSISLFFLIRGAYKKVTEIRSKEETFLPLLKGVNWVKSWILFFVSVGFFGAVLFWHGLIPLNSIALVAGVGLFGFYMVCLLTWMHEKVKKIGWVGLASEVILFIVNSVLLSWLIYWIIGL